MSDIGKLKSAIKTAKTADSGEIDVLNAIVALLTKKDKEAAAELWGEFVDNETKKELGKKVKNIDSLFEMFNLPESVEELMEIRATRAGMVDFRTRVGKNTKEYLNNLVADNKDSEATPAEAGLPDEGLPTGVDEGLKGKDFYYELPLVHPSEEAAKKMLTDMGFKERKVKGVTQYVSPDKIEYAEIKPVDGKARITFYDYKNSKALSEAEIKAISEKIVRTVDSKGNVTKKVDRKTRKRKANQNSTLSRSERKRVARKAAKTKKRDKAGQKRAVRKQKKAKKRRAARGIK